MPRERVTIYICNNCSKWCLELFDVEKVQDGETKNIKVCEDCKNEFNAINIIKETKGNRCVKMNLLKMLYIMSLTQKIRIRNLNNNLFFMGTVEELQKNEVTYNSIKNRVVYFIKPENDRIFITIEDVGD